MTGSIDPPLPASVEALLDRVGPGPILWLTGAGVSAESGVPTFRGEEGYWRVGSRNYHPMELATFAAFTQMPADVWSWYLYRRAVCRAAGPNIAHRALADLEATLGDDFLLVTQNVDGLHLRAGSTVDRTYQIHGNIDFMRSVHGHDLVPVPEALGTEWPKGRRVTEDELTMLVVAGQPARPHVLWFDEYYDETLFRLESSLAAAGRCALLIVVGTTGATNLPIQVGSVVARRGAPMLVINPEPNPFSRAVDQSDFGVYLQGTSGEWVPRLCERLARLR